jgi:hypothetical protein
MVSSEIALIQLPGNVQVALGLVAHDSSLSALVCAGPPTLLEYISSSFELAIHKAKCQAAHPGACSARKLGSDVSRPERDEIHCK